MRMKYEFKHGTISLKTGTISLKRVKEVVTRNWLNMASESDYESDAVRKVVVGNLKKKVAQKYAIEPWFKCTNLGDWTMVQSHKTGRLILGLVAQFCATEPWFSRLDLCD